MTKQDGLTRRVNFGNQKCSIMTSQFVPCPHCGGDIKSDATFCRHCGSSDSDGWKEHDDYGPDDEDAEYEQFLRDNNLGDGIYGSDTNLATKRHWRLVAVILLLLFFFGYLLI